MSEAQPLISIITAVYNGQAFVSETIASVLDQTYRNWEYWIVDDGSTDGTTDLVLHAVRSHPENIHYLEHPGHLNQGLCASRNLALSRARGKYIAIIDADDVWYPQKLAEQTAIAARFPHAGLIYGRSQYWHSWNSASPTADHVPELVPGNRLYEPPQLLALNHPLGSFGSPCPSDLLIDRELFVSLGGFEKSFDRVHSQSEDLAFLAKLYLAAPSYVSTQCWDRYRIHRNSMWATGERTGAAEVGRRVYFDWAREYLLSHQVTSPEIWRLWRRQSRRYRHPVLYRIGKAAGCLTRAFTNR